MSAWIVNKAHIDLLVSAAIAAEIIPPSKATEVGRMLWRENLRSVAYRYPNDRDGDRPGPADFRDRHIDLYEWRETPVLRGGELAKTVGCYDYQSCEHPEWPTSEACQLAVKLQATAGVDDDAYSDLCPWGWSGVEHHAIMETGEADHLVDHLFYRCECGFLVGWVDKANAIAVQRAEQSIAAHFARFGVAA